LRVAVFSDIHGNISGLKAVLLFIDKLGDVDTIVAAGDLLGGGPGTENVIDILIDRNVHVLKGNMDEVWTDFEGSIEKVPVRFHDYVYETTAWLHGRMSRPYWEFLSDLPLFKTIEIAPGHVMMLCHSTPKSAWEPVCAAHADRSILRAAYGSYDAEVIVYGHFHSHHVIPMESKLLVNVASVGLGTEGMSALTVIDYVGGHWAVKQYMLPYDVHEEKRLMHELRVPEFR